MRYLLAMGLLLAVALSAIADDAPAPFVAVYALSQGAVSFGTMERRFELDAGGAYRFVSRMKTSGVVALFRSDKINESSSGQLRDGHFEPERYSYSNSHGHKRHALHFDYRKRVVTRSDQAAGWQAAMPGPVLDKLVYQMQMMLDLATLAPTLRYTVADKNKLKNYQFDNRGREDVETANGSYSAVRLERGAADHDRRTVVWCAEALHWLPVKVEYREKDGSVTTALLASLRTP
jgi:Protein of unknown function (DUF3108)